MIPLCPQGACCPPVLMIVHHQTEEAVHRFDQKSACAGRGTVQRTLGAAGRAHHPVEIGIACAESRPVVRPLIPTKTFSVTWLGSAARNERRVTTALMNDARANNLTTDKVVAFSRHEGGGIAKGYEKSTPSRANRPGDQITCKCPNNPIEDARYVSVERLRAAKIEETIFTTRFCSGLVQTVQENVVTEGRGGVKESEESSVIIRRLRLPKICTSTLTKRSMTRRPPQIRGAAPVNTTKAVLRPSGASRVRSVSTPDPVDMITGPSSTAGSRSTPPAVQPTSRRAELCARSPNQLSETGEQHP